MSKPAGTLISRKVDFRVDEVALKGIGKLGGWKAKTALSLTRLLTGGDWVGGRAHLTATHLHYRPDLLHRMGVKDADALAFALDLSEVTGVSTRWVLLKKAVDVVTRDGRTLSLACEGATKFARAIRAGTGLN